MGSRGRIISEILICTHSLNMVTPGADSVVLGAEEIQKREIEEIILPGKEESGVGWVRWAAGPRQTQTLSGALQGSRTTACGESYPFI